MSLSVAVPVNAEKKVTKQEIELRNLTKTFIGLEKPLKNAQTVDTLPELIQELHNVFDQDSVNIEYVNHLLMGYKSNPSEWKKFAKFDRFRYTRNLVDAGNGKFNLMILCWGAGHGSAIHDHAESHCFMKMLSGQLSEVRYEWPKDQRLSTGGNGEIYQDAEGEETVDGEEELKEISRYTMDLNDVCYINGRCEGNNCCSKVINSISLFICSPPDNLGLHRVENPDHSNVAVSLHLYCPPFDACSVFNKKTGRQTKSKVTFWSVNGTKIREPKAPEDN